MQKRRRKNLSILPCFKFETYVTEEDEFGIYSNIILKHYVAEGVVTDHTLLLASHDISSRKLVSCS